MTTPRPEGRGFQPSRAGFLFHSRLHPGGPGVSDISSAGITRGTPGYGKTCRKNVLRGVDVPVVPGAAGRARPCRVFRLSEASRCPHDRAGLADGVPAVDRDHVPPGLAALYSIMRAEGAPPAIGDGLSQGAVADHVRHGEVFDRDHVMVADQAGAGLVEEVGAGGADLPVGAGDFRFGLRAVGGPVLAAGHAPLVPGEVPPRRSRCRGLGIFWPSVVTAKSLIPRSTPTTRPVAGTAPGRALDGERDVPASARVTGDGHRRRVDRRRVRRPATTTRTSAACPSSRGTAAVAPPEPGASVLGGLPTVPGLEPRVPGPAGEERGVRDLLVADRLLERDRGHLVQPRQFFGGFHGGQVGAGLGEARPGRSAWYRWCRHASVRFHTTRTQPNVRLSTLACLVPGTPGICTPSSRTPSLSGTIRTGKRDTPRGGAAFPPRPEGRGLHAAKSMIRRCATA